MKRLLVLACSARKRQDDEPLPAVARYDGPAFRVLRRYLSECVEPDLRIMILSARFGLIEAGDPIPNYDCKMTAERARDLAPQVERRLAALDASGEHGWRAEACFALLGKQYLAVLARCSSPLARQIVERNTPGGQGVKLAHLHRWLRLDADDHIAASKPVSVQIGGHSTQPIRFKGQDFKLSANDLERLLDDQVEPLPLVATNSAWKVVVDGRQVAPKWLVSLATGIPVSDFTTTEARRFLVRLGVETISP